MRPYSTALILVALLPACSSAPDPATLVLTNGLIVTVDDALPEAEALAVADGRILAVGTVKQIAPYIGPATEVIDLEGQLAIPGFIEGHGHYLNMGRARMILDLTTAASWREIVDMVAEASANADPGSWITGHGWHQEKWDQVPEGSVYGIPTHRSLSAASPDNPVYLTHASGHAAFANAAAMRAAGVSPETPNPPGGEVIRDARGQLTGHFRETAQELIEAALASSRESMTHEERYAEVREQARLAAEESLENGITSYHDAGSSFATVDLLRQLADEEALPVRLYVMIRASVEDLKANMARYRLIGYGDNALTVRSVKISMDGALGSHGAWLLAPYEDLASSVGLNTADPVVVMRKAELCLQHDFQLNIHAIGDQANRVVLNIFEDAYDKALPNADLRWRIEHAQHLHPNDIPRFGEIGVIASMQGVHASSDGPWVLQRLGEKRAREGAYVWRTLWETGAVVTNGTDAPVEHVSPIASFYATVSRMMSDGRVFYGDERLTRDQALQSYTLNNAYAAFEEDIKGSLTPGKLADITVLTKDIMSIPEDEIPTTNVAYTIVGGQVRYAQ